MRLFFSYSVKLGERNDLTRILAKGIFKGAEVVRGQDWLWADQDGEWAWLVAMGVACCLFYICTFFCLFLHVHFLLPGGDGNIGHVIDVRRWEEDTFVSWGRGLPLSVGGRGHIAPVFIVCCVLCRGVLLR